jgi:hypothetical protein
MAPLHPGHSLQDVLKRSRAAREHHVQEPPQLPVFCAMKGDNHRP